MATANLEITLPTVGGSTDTWGGTLNTGITKIDALFSVSGTDVTMANVKFNSIGLQETGAGTDTVKIQAPSAVTQHTLTMPGAVPSANEVLTASDGSGTLSWAAPTVGDITSVVAGAGMTGGGTSGAVTLNVIGTADKITVSADAVTIASGYVGQSSITTLGTIGTGVWNGTAITGAYIDPTSSPLANTKIWIGSASNVAAEFALSGDATMSAGGAVTVVAAPAGTLTGTTLKSTVVTSSLTAVGTIATGVWNGTAIANANLANSTVAYGGVTLALGASDATPAFNLSDATAYTGDSALVTTGTITSGTWQGTTVAVNKGGTGLASYAAGDIVYASGATTLAKLAKGSDTEVLTLASGVPTWAAPTVGDITGVTAGTGLSGGGTTGTVTLNVEAAQTQITSVGALGAGSISSGFGAIDVGSSSIDGGTITGTFVGNVTGNASGSSGSCTGNSATATLASTVTVAASGGDATSHIAMFDSATGSLAALTDPGITYNATTNVLTSTFAGALTGNVTGNASGSALTVTQAAQTAITSVGTLSALTVTGALVANDDVTMAATKKLYLDGGGDTYLAEQGADDFHIFVGGSEKMRLTGNTARFPGAYANTTGSAVNMFVSSSGDLARSTSSLRYKTDVVDYELERAQSLIAALEPISYRHKQEDHHHLGFTAEAVSPLEPLLVALNEDGEPDSLEYERIVVPLTAVVQSQMAEIAALTDRIAALEASASDGV